MNNSADTKGTEMTAKTADEMIENIEAQATGSFGYNMVAIVTCPHCGGTMEAIDAKMHVKSAEAKWVLDQYAANDQGF